MFSKTQLSALFICVLVLVSCQKNEALMPEMEAAKNASTINGPIVSAGPSPEIPCFNVAPEFEDMAATIFIDEFGQLQPAVFTDDEGTLDNRICEAEGSGCIGNDEIITLFTTSPQFPNATLIDHCALFCRDFDLTEQPVSPQTQELIYDRAIALANNNRPTCSSSGSLMQVVEMDFYVNYYFEIVDGEFRDFSVVELAVRYRCCDGAGGVPS